MTHQEFISQYNSDGYIISKNVFEKDFTIDLRKAILNSLELQAAIIGKYANRYYGKLICAPMFGDKHPIFFELLKYSEWLTPVRWILDELFIVNLYASSCIPPQNDIASQYIHVDQPRLIPGYHLGMGVMICTDDFTIENGATRLLKGSHIDLKKPEEQFFRIHADHFVAPAGSVLYFNPRIWHATGVNTSSDWRTSLVLGFGRPWVKQWVDIPRLLGKYNIDTESYPDEINQLLGFYCQAPDNLEEFTLPAEKRMFRQKVV